MSPWLFLRLLFLPAAVVAGYMWGGWGNFFTPACVFILHPIAGIFLQKHIAHHDEKKDEDHSLRSYRVVALFYVPVLIILTAWSIYCTSNHEFSFPELTGFAISVGIVNGVIGFTLAHEFIHHFTLAERIAGHVLLLVNNYLHYSIEHIWGHHVYACTSRDPHTARSGESFYTYFPRAVKGTYRNAWIIQKQQLARKNQPLFSYHNRMLLFAIIQAAATIAIVLLAGWTALLFFILQSVVAITLLHVVNYLQHYGLVRNEIAPGKFEKLDAHHAWNSGKAKDGLNLFQIEKHADHHLHPSHPYETLVHHDESPEHPTGYSGMILLALVPPLWFQVMHKRIPFNN